MAHSAMFARIKRLYDARKLDENGVWNAAQKNFITNEEANEILGITPED